MTSVLGLIELLLVLVGGMGWGAYELWSVRRDLKKQDGRAPSDKRKP